MGPSSTPAACRGRTEADTECDPQGHGCATKNPRTKCAPRRAQGSSSARTRKRSRAELELRHPITMTSLSVIDSHTGGEPTRIIVGGGPDLDDVSVAQKLESFRKQYDRLRSA